MTTPTKNQIDEASRLRNRAADSDAKAEESFQRCDTDGFLSQWALGLGAQRDRLQASILEDGGMHRFTGLWQGERRVLARTITTQFGTSWMLHDSETDLISARGKKFVPWEMNPGQSRILKKLGLVQKYEMAPAEAVIEGRGTGLSGTAWVTARRTGCVWGSDAVPETKA